MASHSVTWQASLFALGEPSVRHGATTERIDLDATSWIDLTRGFLEGADGLRHVDLLGGLAPAPAPHVRPGGQRPPTVAVVRHRR